MDRNDYSGSPEQAALWVEIVDFKKSSHTGEIDAAFRVDQSIIRLLQTFTSDDAGNIVRRETK
jgi:hypothetical protein